MRKSLFISSIVICLSTIGYGNTSEESSAPTTETIPQYRTRSIKTLDDFDKYFKFSTTSSYNSESKYSEKTSTYYYEVTSTSTITITPKLSGFVDYTGHVIFAAKSKNNKPAIVMKNRGVFVDYWGSATDTYKVKDQSATYDSDQTLKFSDVEYYVSEADITITYHDEGLSGNTNLTYESIKLTKYNYTSYLNISVSEGREYYDKAYHYTMNYKIMPSSNVKGPVEFIDTVLTFNNGISVNLDATGNTTRTGDVSLTSHNIPTVTDVSGNIDFYPPATLQYQTTLYIRQMVK